jgi:hypothetical protein
MAASTATPGADRLLTAAEAAAKLGVEIHTLHHWHARHFGPPVVAGPDLALAYWRSDLEAWLDRLGET